MNTKSLFLQDWFHCLLGFTFGTLALAILFVNVMGFLFIPLVLVYFVFCFLVYMQNDVVVCLAGDRVILQGVISFVFTLLSPLTISVEIVLILLFVVIFDSTRYKATS
jgi:hypothetical protein